MEAPPAVAVEPLHAFRYHHASGGVDIALGDLVSGQQVEVVMTSRAPGGKARKRPPTT